MVVALALLSACSGTDCGPRTELQAGDPCGRLFTYCTAGMVCCLSAGSTAPICAMEPQCRRARLGEACDDNPWSAQCEYDLTCQDGRCVCAPGCSSTYLCWRDESSCVYNCCWGRQRCVNGWCVAPPLDSRPDVRRDARSDRPRDAAVDKRGDAGRDLGSGEPGGDRR